MTAPQRRRNNAPVRPRRPATGVPDLLFSFGMALVTMALIFLVATFTRDDLSSGDAGTQIARIFAGTLTLSALMLFLLGMLLLRDEKKSIDHYRVPLVVGGLAGALESWLFLEPQGAVFLLAPIVLFIFAARPVRRYVSGLIGDRRGRL